MNILFIIIAVIVGWFILGYNLLVKRRISIRNAWSQIDVQLKRRYDLIPNLIEVAKGYMAYEKETLERVIKARQQAIDVSGVKQGSSTSREFSYRGIKTIICCSRELPRVKGKSEYALSAGRDHFHREQDSL